MLKKNKLRYNEYYDMQHIYDELYAQSKNGNNFYKLLEIIGSEQNICLAYRNLKSNSGSKTAGTDGMTIDDIKQLSNAEIVATVRESLSNYRPKSVRRSVLFCSLCLRIVISLLRFSLLVRRSYLRYSLQSSQSHHHTYR